MFKALKKRPVNVQHNASFTVEGGYAQKRACIYTVHFGICLVTLQIRQKKKAKGNDLQNLMF